jgi:excinuclease ABC subunit A
MKDIIVKGAREHNLKNIDVTIPREKFVVISGLSGSGKSTLAFNTIYAEGQRRYVESLSSYARQFLGNQDKPDVDSIEGLSPAISIEQKTTSKNPRSTVGTVTEIYDYLRLLYARIGTSHCPKCDSKIKPQSSQNITELILSEENKKIIILSPVIVGQKGTYEKVFEKLVSDGFSKVRVDGIIYNLDEINKILKLKRYERHWIEIVIDRIKICKNDRQRISDSVEQGLNLSNGNLIVLDFDLSTKLISKYQNEKNLIIEKKLKLIQKECEKTYSTFGACEIHKEMVFTELEPRQFSFNSPFGACGECLGLGKIIDFSTDLIIPNPNLSISENAISIWGSKVELTWQIKGCVAIFKKYNFDIFTPINKLSKSAYKSLLFGDEEITSQTTWNGKIKNKYIYEGIIPMYKRLSKQTESENRRKHFEKFMTSSLCKKCNGKRLNENMLSVKITDKNIDDVCNLSIEKCFEFFKNLKNKLNEKDLFIAKQILKEINQRLEFLNNVGLNYLSLSRSSGTLSGGESQRIRLATQIGSNLIGVLYVLDEPSIGLHQRDNSKLIETLHKLRDLGNTLIVIEHDEDTIRASDYVIDIGPGAGINGGEVMAVGTPKQIEKNPKSITGLYLSKKKKIEISKIKRIPKDFIELIGASENNLKNINVKFPTQIFTTITGVSGSGKSTLVSQTLMPALKKHFRQVVEKIGKHKSIKIPKNLRNIIVINQDPIGRTPRSNPATYIKVFDNIRTLFSNTKQAKSRGYKEGRFSFNVKGGRCETCKGDGTIKIEMNFLPDVYVVCEECKGKRYNKDTLEITYKGLNISEVLNLDVDKATKFFENHSLINRKIKTLKEVGLGYLKLGQPSTQLSGGESQRIKITKELAKLKKGNTIYILDEPTTGLHFEDVNKLIKVINKLVDKENTIFVIEHNLDVIMSSDYVIDLGLEGGIGGGEIIATGTPKEISKNKKSHTGKFLKKMF